MKNVKRIIKALCIVVVVLLLVSVGNDLLFTRHSHCKIRLDGFYLEDKDSLDVVVIGASDVYSGYSAGYAFEKYGFTSYPYAVPSDMVTLWKAQLKEVIKYQSPKMIVFEINGALYETEDYNYNEGYIRNQVDNMPMSKNKVELIKSLDLQDPENYYFPFLKYHSNWTSIDNAYFNVVDTIKMKSRGYSLLKGNYLKPVICKRKRFESPKIDDAIPLNKGIEKDFREFLQYCKDEKIDNILFTRFPHIIGKDTQVDRIKRTNTAEKIIKEYGYDFLNLEKNYDKVGIDFKRDFSSIDHLNMYGQKKVTDYIGKVLTEEYGVTKTKLTADQRENWEESVKYNNMLYRACEDRQRKGKKEVLNEIGYKMKIIEKYDTEK